MIHQFVKVFLVMSLLLLLSYGCDKRASSLNSLSTESEQKLNQNMNSDRASDFLKVIAEISNKINLVSRSKNSMRETLEIRLWTNVGTFFEKLLVVSSREHVSNASFYEIDRSGESLKFQRKNLLGPHSGWHNFLSSVGEKGFQVPLKFKSEQPLSSSRDEGLIILEIFDRGNYDFVYYGQFASSVDAETIFASCEYLASEFDLAMDCRQEYTSP